MSIQRNADFSEWSCSFLPFSPFPNVHIHLGFKPPVTYMCFVLLAMLHVTPKKALNASCLCDIVYTTDSAPCLLKKESRERCDGTEGPLRSRRGRADICKLNEMRKKKMSWISITWKRSKKINRPAPAPGFCLRMVILPAAISIYYWRRRCRGRGKQDQRPRSTNSLHGPRYLP